MDRFKTRPAIGGSFVLVQGNEIDLGGQAFEEVGDSIGMREACGLSIFAVV